MLTDWRSNGNVPQGFAPKKYPIGCFFLGSYAWFKIQVKLNKAALTSNYNLIDYVCSKVEFKISCSDIYLIGIEFAELEVWYVRACKEREARRRREAERQATGVFFRCCGCGCLVAVPDIGTSG